MHGWNWDAGVVEVTRFPPQEDELRALSDPAVRECFLMGTRELVCLCVQGPGLD